MLAYVESWQKMTERMGYWVDFEDAYRTMDARYVESVWWTLQRIHDRGLLVEDYRVAPYCPRCQTALSSHELGQPGVYSEVTSPSVFVRLPITTGAWAREADLLIWTTTPWTLVSNTAVAVHPDVDYARVRPGDGTRDVVVAAALAESVLGEGAQVVQRRILDLAEVQPPDELTAALGMDFWLIDGRDVIAMHYAPDGQFRGGEVVDTQYAASFHAVAEMGWRLGAGFDSWWQQHPQHHRSTHRATEDGRILVEQPRADCGARGDTAATTTGS